MYRVLQGGKGGGIYGLGFKQCRVDNEVWGMGGERLNFRLLLW